MSAPRARTSARAAASFSKSPASERLFRAFRNAAQTVDRNGRALEQKFLQFSWKLHPDNFVKATETERELSLKRSSELNDAYRTLRDPVARVEYLLEHRGHAQGRRAQAAGPARTARGSLRAERIARRVARSKSGRKRSRALKSRLESAEKNFQAKSLAEVDAQLQGTAREWDAATGCQRGRSPHARKSWRDERTAQSPLLHPEFGHQRSKGVVVTFSWSL